MNIIFNQVMTDANFKPRRAIVMDELFEEMKAKDDEIRDSKKLAIAGKKKNEEAGEDYLE